jgi:putative endonuclease
MEHAYYVYIMKNHHDTTLYIGVTNDLTKRVWQHKNKISSKSFTSKYNVDKLVYFEVTQDVVSALAMEKLMKKWKRQWKIDLINKFNPEWRDLYNEFYRL